MDIMKTNKTQYLSPEITVLELIIESSITTGSTTGSLKDLENQDPVDRDDNFDID